MGVLQRYLRGRYQTRAEKGLATDSLPRLLAFLQSWFRALKTISQNRALRVLVNVLVFGFCIYYLAANLNTIAVELRSLQFNGYFLAVALLITWFVDWIGGLSWWLLLHGFGQGTSLLDSLRIHFQSSIAKYVPGFVWQYVGKIYLTGEIGVPAVVTGRILVWEFIQPVWTGFATALLFAPTDLLFNWGLPGWAAIVIRLFGILLLLGWGGVILSAPRFLTRGGGSFLVRPLYLAGSALVVLSGWVLLGAVQWLNTLAFGGDAITIPYSVFVITISMVIGILVIPVPNGLGIREGILSALLGIFVSVPVAVLIASVSRLQLVTGEFFCVLLTWLWGKIFPQSTKKGRIRVKYS